MNRPSTKEILFLTVLVSLGVTARVALQHVPNFAPVAGLALFAGFLFRRKWLALAVPLAILFISDRLVEAGSYDWRVMITVYGLLTLPVALHPVLQRALQGRSSWSRLIVGGATVVGTSLACSLIFFLGTNLMVWYSSTWYPATAAGLVECYASALPFFRYTAAGDQCFALLCFGSYAAVRAWQETGATSTAPANH